MNHSILAVAALVLVVGTGQVGAQSRAAHQFQKCTACHGMPDPSIPGDKLWIGQIARTACVVPKAPQSNALRRSLIAFLSGKQAERPTVVDREGDLGDGEGYVNTNLQRGSMMLYPEAGGRGPVRLVWNKAENGRRRAVPAGRYRIRNYKVIKRDDEGVEWQIWSSSPRGAMVIVRPGERALVNLDKRVHVKACGGPTKKGDLRAGLMIHGHHRSGLTVVRAGKRVHATYGIFAGDREVRSGDLDYG